MNSRRVTERKEIQLTIVANDRNAGHERPESASTGFRISLVKAIPKRTDQQLDVANSWSVLILQGYKIPGAVTPTHTSRAVRGWGRGESFGQVDRKFPSDLYPDRARYFSNNCRFIFLR